MANGLMSDKFSKGVIHHLLGCIENNFLVLLWYFHISKLRKIGLFYTNETYCNNSPVHKDYSHMHVQCNLLRF